MAAPHAIGTGAARRSRASARPAGLLALAALLLAPGPAARAYADRAGTDVVMDSPWRTVRDTIPVLFFFPQFERGRRVERVRILECVDGAPVGPAVVVDAAGGPDTLNGATFVGALGEPRGGIGADERITSHWHYVVRVPHAALRAHRAPDVHDLRAEVEWTRPGRLGHRTFFRSSRVLRVIVDRAPFPSFAPEDRYLDTHVHTIAEQTTAGVLDPDGAVKAYGGPLVMLFESAYALGLTDRRPAGDWDGCADAVAVTDHNVFYSGEPYDTGTAPRFGPTAATDGRAGEAAWYRAHLGRLAGEEISLRRGSNQDASPRPNLGHHLLAYGTCHFEGPWHGGRFLTSGLENPNTVEALLAGMKAAGAGGFAYAAHPDLAGFVWPREYWAQAIGLPPFDSRTGPQVDSAGTGFLFKGAEVWNGKLDQVARGSGRLPASSAFDAMNPFAGGPRSQRFTPRAWDGELASSLDTLFDRIGRGLRFAFREAPAERFVRKLYLSAGSDAHGDFDYTDEVLATAAPYSGGLNGNAFARVRTYALVHERPEGSRDVVAALAAGNTVITDGPILTFALDADGHYDAAAGVARWHDGASRWESADGGIGGAGPFDGGRTLLAPSGAEPWIRSVWKPSVSPGAGGLRTIRFDRIAESARDTFAIAAGPAEAGVDAPLPVPLERLCALVATARDSAIDERCITNPVWVAPVRVTIEARPAAGSPALPPGGLRVVFHFPFSMSPSALTRVAVRPLDGSGTSAEPEVPLAPEPGWEAEDGIACARFTAVNRDTIPPPPAGWDAVAHRPAPDSASFVVYLERPTDLHGNVLNDVARTVTLPRAAAPPR